MLRRLLAKTLLFGTDVGTQNECKRKQWIQQQLAGIPSGLRILDAGAGELANKQFCKHLDYVSQDYSQYDGKGDQAGLQTSEWDTSKINIVSDITQIPEPDESYDAILCSEVLEHLPDPALVFSEFKRLLKPGGILLLTAPFISLTHFAPYHYQSGFNKYYYEYHLSKHLFRNIELTFNGNFFEVLAQEIRRIPHVCTMYMGIRPPRWFNVICNWQLYYLNKLSKAEQNSSELLSYGIFVRAIRQ